MFLHVAFLNYVSQCELTLFISTVRSVNLGLLAHFGGPDVFKQVTVLCHKSVSIKIGVVSLALESCESS